jgi:hypothetical protein
MIHELWSVIVIAGLLGWLFSTVMLLLNAFPKKDVFVVSSGFRWGSAGIISFFVWIVGMLNA